MTAVPVLQTAPRASWAGSLRSELLKLTSLTSVRWTFVIAVAAGIVGAILQVGIAVTPTAALLGSTVFSAAAIGVIGAVAGSSEYATKTIGPSLMATPRRAAFLFSKLVVSAIAGAAVSLVSAVLGMLVVGLVPRADDVAAIAGCTAYGAAVGAFAACFGMVIRSAAGSVAGILGFLILLPGLLGAIRLGDGYLSDFSVAESGGRLVTAPTAGDAVAAALALAVWLAACGTVALVRLVRTDA